eukprot:PhF_6_TR7022/c0_g4_i2/m.10477
MSSAKYTWMRSHLQGACGVRRLTNWECPRCTVLNEVVPEMFAKPQLTEKPLICKACKTPYDPAIDHVQPSHNKEHQTYVICTSSDLEPFHYMKGQKSLQSGPSP